MCQYSSDDLWEEFDEVVLWFHIWNTKLEKAEKYLQVCNEKYSDVVTNPSRWFETTTVINLYAEKEIAESRVNDLHTLRQEYMNRVRRL